MAFSDPIDPAATSDPCEAGEPRFAGPQRSSAALRLELPADLQAELQDQAELQGCSLADLVEELLRGALGEIPAGPAGRCSTRMGRCSSGPVPLPVQQL
jgi:hypothetical protein